MKRQAGSITSVLHVNYGGPGAFLILPAADQGWKSGNGTLNLTFQQGNRICVSGFDPVDVGQLRSRLSTPNHGFDLAAKRGNSPYADGRA